MPEWARGKTAEEVLGITKTLVERGLGGPVAQPVQQAAPVQQATVGDDDYITGREMRAMFAQAAQNLNPTFAQNSELAASAVLGTARQIYAKEFQRYGPEIAAKLATVPKNLWTLDNIETVVKLVKVDHHDELVREDAAKLAATMEPTIRSTGVGGSVSVPSNNKDVSLESDKIPADWRERARRAGIDERTVREFCQANEMAEETFYKQFETPRNAIVAESRTDAEKREARV